VGYTSCILHTLNLYANIITNESDALAFLRSTDMYAALKTQRPTPDFHVLDPQQQEAIKTVWLHGTAQVSDHKQFMSLIRQGWFISDNEVQTLSLPCPLSKQLILMAIHNNIIQPETDKFTNLEEFMNRWIHGLSRNFLCNKSMGAVQDQIESSLPGIYVYSIEIGDNIIIDEISGFLANVNDQVQYVCNKLKKNANLTGGFNAIGFSQGGQFLRAYVERCNDPPVHNLITMGGQHQGISDFPECVYVNTTICETVEDLLALGAYNELVQDLVVQAQYYKDPMDIQSYLTYNQFLTDINNEITVNVQYKQRFTSLNQLVLAMFAYDTTVVPKESEWFGEYQPGNVNIMLSMNETKLYKEDTIGLKTLHQAGKVKFLSVPGNHMQFTLQWLTDNVIMPYLAN